MTGAGQPVTAFPWDEIMGFAFGHWRLSPAEFWASTLREIAAAIAASMPISMKTIMVTRLVLMPASSAASGLPPIAKT